tara:strand:- start:804 stop:1007 length:204 start_codon:yes stop_codon:yes gene_type:complete
MSKTVPAFRFAELIKDDLANQTGESYSLEFLIPRIEKVAIMKDEPEIPIDKYILDVLSKAKGIRIII